MARIPINTPDAPAAIGTYSQAMRTGNLLFVSGQIPLDPNTMEVVPGDFSAQAERVFANLAAILKTGNATLDDCVKLTVYLTDLGNFAAVNEVMSGLFSEPYPARAAIEVSALPKGVAVEVDAIAEVV